MICGALFLCGALLGAYGARFADQALSDYLEGWLSILKGGELSFPSFWQVLWNTVKYPLLVVFFSFSLVGVVAIPVVSAVRGFLLSFSAIVMINTYGSGAWGLVLSVLGLGSLFSIPCLFLLSAQSFGAALSLLQMVAGTQKRGILGICNRRWAFGLLLVCGVLLLSAVVETFLLPKLIGSMPL